MPEPLFAGLVGQQQATALLLAALERQRLAPAYLFCGPDGVGRSIAARRLLEGVIAGPGGSASVRRRLQEGNHPDLLWVEPTYSDKGQLVPASRAAEAGVSRKAPPQLRLEQVRAVSQFLARRPVEAERCLVVIEAVEAMAEGAANALLKTLEEPGDGLLILLTVAPDRLLSCSRCWPSEAFRGAVPTRRNWWSWRPAPRGLCCSSGSNGRPCRKVWPSAAPRWWDPIPAVAHRHLAHRSVRWRR